MKLRLIALTLILICCGILAAQQQGQQAPPTAAEFEAMMKDYMAKYGTQVNINST